MLHPMAWQGRDRPTAETPGAAAWWQHEKAKRVQEEAKSQPEPHFLNMVMQMSIPNTPKCYSEELLWCGGHRSVTARPIPPASAPKSILPSASSHAAGVALQLAQVSASLCTSDFLQDLCLLPYSPWLALCSSARSIECMVSTSARSTLPSSDVNCSH